MATDGLLADSTAAPRMGRAELAARGAFVVLLAAVPLMPVISSSVFTFPAVNNWWVCLPLCTLFLLTMGDVRRPLRVYNLDLLVLGSFIIPLGCYGSSRTLPVQLLYPPLAYLAVRMLFLARVGRGDSARAAASPVLRPWLPWRWLLVGVVVLAAVHVHWALTGRSSSDVGEAGVWGASRIAHGKGLYGPDKALTAKLGGDPHFDTYGPFNYEAYVPFVSVTSPTTAARLASLFFCLLTAGLLFALGRRLRGPPEGLALALAWLVYPFTLYSDGFDFNDALLAAALVGALLVADSPARRGTMAALAGWTKLSPLALVPVLMAYPGPAGERRWRTAAIFSAGFALTSMVIFVPAVDHGSLGTFLSRSFGYQSQRTPGFSIWALYEDSFHQPPWIVGVAKVVHGLLLALTLGLALTLPRLPRRQDLIGLAAVSATVLIALQICDGYYSFSYLLWFVPLVLVALSCESGAPAARAHLPLRRAVPAAIKASAGPQTSAEVLAFEPVRLVS
jgi:hypothetical protein